MSEKITKHFYRIREVSEMLNIPASTLRFWESEFSQLRPRRNNGHTRFYTPNDVELLRHIKYLIKDKGLRIEAAKSYLNANRSGENRKLQVISRLQEIRNELQSILDGLNKRQ